MTRLFRLAAPRRYTANWVTALDVARRPFLLKYTRDAAEAWEEARGHTAIRDHYRVPARYASVPLPRGRLTLLERVGASGRDEGLLLDLLNAADDTDPEIAQPAQRTLAEYLRQMTGVYRRVMLATARQTPPAQLVRKLYWDRAAPGGRLDQYYAGRDFLVADGLVDVPVSRFHEYQLTINGEAYRLDWDAFRHELRALFARDEPVWSAITQGDPTDVNLAVPLAWLDLDTGGRNALAGEFANFLWYMAFLGGYLVPRHNPAAFIDHPCTFARIPDNAPELRVLDVDHRRRSMIADLALRPAHARRYAIATYWREVVEPVSAELGFTDRIDQMIRPYLAMRIIAVHNLADLEPRDRLVLLLGLVLCMSGRFSAARFFHLEDAWAPSADRCTEPPPSSPGPREASAPPSLYGSPGTARV
ncbi:hypothetical protein LI90_273 [Carbonactinospora thermoautotrophica]|uniref:Uncharacterized protein n=1 Tax=Carbonactinospora thermoautotrophica TaxID=1469144 RepID=A0A132MLE2_9ACTN|nr:hypothetical protein [Carbonactinospora thermoautotrophica]KWW98646.1 hypothetical protein LI90_273 [Carbonactinospora thermoautotrophica]